LIIGIDLATVNCGLCFMEEEDKYNFATIGMKDLEDETILKFADSLSLLVHKHVCFVDFYFNECFLPNKRKHIALKYYLAANIKRSAKEAYFIKPSAVREYFGHSPKMNKYKFHEEMFSGEMMKQENEHHRDAYLLALMGWTEQSKHANPSKWGN